MVASSRRHNEEQKDAPGEQKQTRTGHDHEEDEVMMRALTAVFGMANNGKIDKVKAREVVENLGLVAGEEEEGEGDEEGGEVGVEEVLSDVYCSSLLRDAFRIFDQDGNGYIEPDELKRVLHCLGLDRGSSWDLSDFNAMLKCVDLNSDGKVDFNEFQLMMMVPSSS
ncbi:unnamed protein product [Linum trigynum]